MTVSSKVFVQGKRVASSPSAADYVSTNTKSKIDSATVTNTSSDPQLFSAWLVPNGGAVSDATKVIDDVSIAPGHTYLCPELLGRNLDQGDALWSEASTADTLSLRVDGRMGVA